MFFLLHSYRNDDKLEELIQTRLQSNMLDYVPMQPAWEHAVEMKVKSSNPNSTYAEKSEPLSSDAKKPNSNPEDKSEAIDSKIAST